MFWLILISHAFNPFFVLLLINLENSHDKKYAIKNPLDIISHILSAFMVYMLWLGLHYVFTFSSFNFDRFIGVGQGVHYFIPFFIGVFMMLQATIIKPALKSESVKKAHAGFIALLALAGIYFMAINHFIWLSR